MMGQNIKHKSMGPATRSWILALAAKGMSPGAIAHEVGWPHQCVAAVMRQGRWDEKKLATAIIGIDPAKSPWTALERLVDGLKADSTQDALRWRMKALMDKAKKECVDVEYGDERWYGVKK
jgi:hypothetical protein